jgi:hypothetical protein
MSGDEPRTSPLSGGFNQQSAMDRVTIVRPMTSYHVDVRGNHVPGFNEHNPGAGLSIPLTSQSGAAGNAPLNLELGAYRNSYAHQPRYQGDRTLYAGVSYLPLQVDMGRLKASAGVMVGVATTERGSYADNMPKFTKEGITGIAALTARLEDSRTGWGVQAMVVPPAGRELPGFVGIALTQKFKP